MSHLRFYIAKSAHGFFCVLEYKLKDTWSYSISYPDRRYFPLIDSLLPISHWGDLINFPNEIIYLIAAKLQVPALNQLSRTCQFLYKLVEPLLYSNISIRDIKGREAFILALSKCPQPHDLVKGMRFDYDRDENPSESFSDLSLANAMPNLERLYIHSPYVEPSKPTNKDFKDFYRDVQRGVALSRLRKCMLPQARLTTVT